MLLHLNGCIYCDWMSKWFRGRELAGFENAFLPSFIWCDGKLYRVQNVCRHTKCVCGVCVAIKSQTYHKSILHPVLKKKRKWNICIIQCAMRVFSIRLNYWPTIVIRPMHTHSHGMQVRSSFESILIKYVIIEPSRGNIFDSIHIVNINQNATSTIIDNCIWNVRLFHVCDTVSAS